MEQLHARHGSEYLCFISGTVSWQTAILGTHSTALL
jgi:hypothetical protein